MPKISVSGWAGRHCRRMGTLVLITETARTTVRGPTGGRTASQQTSTEYRDVPFGRDGVLALD